MKYLASSFAVAAAMVLGGANSASSQEAAEILNHADGAFCYVAFNNFAGIPNALYSGPATFVGTSEGDVNAQCHASLMNGQAVSDNAERIPGIPFNTPFGLALCDITLTPSGQANIECHG